MGLVDTAANIGQVASGLVQFVSRAAPAALSPDRPDRPEKSLDDSMLDLKLPEIIVTWMAPLVKPLAIESVEARGLYGSPTRYYTAIKSDAGQRILFKVPNQVFLVGSNHEYISRVLAALITVLKNQMVFILSDTPDAPHVAYTNVARTWKQQLGISVSFVPGRNIEDLQAMSKEEQKDLLMNLFNLEELLKPASPGAGGAGLSIDDMSVSEIRNIKDIIARLNDFSDIRGRQQVVRNAGLDIVISASFDYQGGAGLVAGTLVDDLIQHGMLRDDRRLPGPPDRQALGLLLCYVCALSDTPRTDVEYLQAIVSKYSLMPSGVCP